MQTLRLLLWLKWKLTLRGYQKNASQIIGAVIMLLIFLPAAIGIGVLCGIGFVVMHGSGNDAHLLRAAFLAIYLMWLLSPLLGYAFNDTYDITRLFVYPIKVRQIFLGTVVGSLLDLTSLFLLPTVLAALYGFSVTPTGGILNLVTVCLFVFHTLTLSQAIILVSAGVLRSRRFRDSLVMLISVLGTLYFLGTMSVAQGMTLFNWRAFLETQTWQIINYFPQGIAARAMEAAKYGRLSDALAYNVILALIAFATLHVASKIVQRVYENGGSEAASAPESPKEKARNERAERAASPVFFRWLPPVMQALIAKEFKYYAREPYFRLMLSNFVYLFVVGLFLANNLSVHASEAGEVSGSMGSSGLVLFTELGMVCNIFGTEGSAITLLFLFPCSRRYLLLGKNVAIFSLLSILNLIYVVLVTAVSGQWGDMARNYLWTAVSLVVFIALGNFSSIYAPYRLVMKGWRVKMQSASKGCSYTMLYFLIMLLAGVIMIPIIAAFFAPPFFGGTAWYALTIPLAFLYAIGLYGASIYLAPRLLEEREEKINATVSQDEV